MESGDNRGGTRPNPRKTFAKSVTDERSRHEEEIAVAEPVCADSVCC